MNVLARTEARINFSYSGYLDYGKIDHTVLSIRIGRIFLVYKRTRFITYKIATLEKQRTCNITY